MKFIGLALRYSTKNGRIQRVRLSEPDWSKACKETFLPNLLLSERDCEIVEST